MEENRNGNSNIDLGNILDTNSLVSETAGIEDSMLKTQVLDNELDGDHIQLELADDELKQELLTTEYRESNKKLLRRVLIVIVASFIQAFTLKNFMNPAEVLPGGFSGLTVLLQRIGLDYYNIEIPYSILNILFNALPAIYAFRNLGKKFVMLSVLGVVNLSILVDLLPTVHITDDVFLNVVFGAMLYAFASVLILNVNACSGGTDFITLSMQNKTGNSAWHYALIFNAFIYVIYGAMFGYDNALYSIIFQFLLTVAIGQGQLRYQRRTAFVITKEPEPLAKELMELTGHGITIFEGKGAYTQEGSYLLYMVIERTDVKLINAYLKQNHPKVFLNITDSEQLQGNFKLEPYD